MTLDEAILHAREVAERNRKQYKNCPSDRTDIRHQTCQECAEEHEQLAEWLEDLKRRREYDDEIMGSGALKNAYKSGYNKAIDDFVTKYKFCDNRSIQCRKALNCADCIAEQLKVVSKWQYIS